MGKIKVIFLDVDGVLNSDRTPAEPKAAIRLLTTGK